MLAKEESEPALKILMHFNSCAFLFELAYCCAQVGFRRYATFNDGRDD